jgi:hypothetical protein
MPTEEIKQRVSAANVVPLNKLISWVNRQSAASVRTAARMRPRLTPVRTPAGGEVSLSARLRRPP